MKIDDLRPNFFPNFPHDGLRADFTKLNTAPERAIKIGSFDVIEPLTHQNLAVVVKYADCDRSN